MPPEPTRWDDMSETEKVEYATYNWTELSAAQRQEYFRINAERNRKREEQRQARIRQQSPEHQQAVREQLDKGTKERAVHRFLLTRQPNSQKCSTEGCPNRKLPYSDKCNTCESD